MNPVLIGVNVLTAMMGLVLILIAVKQLKRAKTIGSVVLWSLVASLGIGILFSSISGLPSKILERLKPLPIVETDEVQVPKSEPPTTELTSDRVIYVGDLDALADAIVERLGIAPGSKEGLIIEEDVSEEDVPERDPFARPELPPEDPITPAKPPAPPTPPKTQRERTLPPEVSTAGAPMCTDFKSLHGNSGGPEPGGCYAVGCAQGYALPMRWADQSWNPCVSYVLLPRLDDCYFVVDQDGTERSMRFKNGSWAPGTCS